MPRYKKRSDGRYATTIVIGHDKYGAPIKKTVYGKTQKDLSNKIADLKVNGEKSENAFFGLAEKWMESHQKIVGTNTMKGYKEALHKLEPLYPIPIEIITVNDVQSIINNLNSQGLSKSLQKRVRLVYSLICNYAISKNINISNLSSQINVPKNAKEEPRDALTEEEMDVVHKSANLPFGIYALLMMYTGLRRGELCALQWGDLDFDNKVIKISRAITYINNRPYIKPPKTKMGYRSIPLLDAVIHYLDPSGHANDEFIFGGQSPMLESTVKNNWNKYIKQAGLEHITQHQLRHSYATILYLSGVDVKTAQSILGHANVETTLGRYTHISQLQKIKIGASDKLNNFIGNSHENEK